MAEMKLVPVPAQLLSEAAGLLDCEGYGPIAAQLNAMLAASPQAPAREGVDTVLFDHAWKMVEAIRGGGTPPFLTADEAANKAAPYLLERLAERNAALTPLEEAPDWAAATQAAWDANNPASEEAPAEGAGERYGAETAPEIVKRWAAWINDASEDMDEPEFGGKTANDVLNERDFLIRSLRARTSEPEAGETVDLRSLVAHVIAFEAYRTAGNQSLPLQWALESADGDWQSELDLADDYLALRPNVHPSPATADKLREALKHYRCSCEPGRCAMSVDGDDQPVDDQMCGRVAAQALATLSPKEEGGE